MSKIENLKKSIQTILDQFPKFELKFELFERELINEFLAVINQYGEADNKRTTLTKHFNNYSDKVMKTSEYLTTPFLWYTVTLSENAITHLSISRFHAQEFYKFLLYQLRELYQLMKKGIKLSSNKYERLQAKCLKADFTLASDEFEMLKTTYSTIKSDKAESLNSKYIKRKIIENTAISRKHKRASEISRFYTLVGGKWWFKFRSSCFGLNRVFFHIQLAKNIELKQIIDFYDPDNTVLGLSDVHQVVNSENEFIGNFLIPNRDTNSLHEYLKQCEQQNNMKIKEFALINQINRSTGFTSYQPDIGWQNLPVKKRKSIIQKLQTNESEERHNGHPINNSHWSFAEYPYPLDIIKLYCKSPDHFSYSQLPFDKSKREIENQFSIAEIGILRYLITKKALEVGFLPLRLNYNYSVNDFFIKIPKIPFKKLVHFLNIIPYAETYFSDYNTNIWTRLPVELISMVKNDLKWTILPVVKTHPLPDLMISWFDSTRLKWISPKVLQM